MKDTVAAEDEKIHVMDFHKKLTSCIRRINDQYKQRLDERKKREEAQKNEKAGGRGGGGLNSRSSKWRKGISREKWKT